MSTLAKAVRVTHGRFLGLQPDINVGSYAQIGRVKVQRPSGGGSLEIGMRARLYTGVRIYLESRQACIAVGKRTYINRRTELICMNRVTIGNDCAISWDVTITDTDYHAIEGSGPCTAPVHIGDHVWVGAGAKILKGVSIGDGAVIGAGAIVNRDISPGVLAAGCPAREIRSVVWTL